MSNTSDSTFVTTTRNLVREILESWEKRTWDAYEDARIKAELQELINEPYDHKS